jgi:LytS/YehU family sensor histidine kinase
MMNYMINDCEADRMPLERELHLLEDYIGLERARYGGRLDMQVSIQGNPGRRRIAPLLMIPFLENSFKHGASQVLDHPWVRLQVCAGDNQLDVRLSNNKPPAAATGNAKSGIGLRNIRQRLQLLYPNRHRLEIEAGEDVFSVRLVVPLEEEPVATAHG